jgi:hypothetical protein
MRLAIVISLLMASACALAADRNIMLLQQLQPAHIISVMVVEHGGHIRVGVNGFGASTLKKSAEMSTAEFARLWELANSKELVEYRLKGDDGSNMADPNYFTVSVGADGKADFDLKIPVKAHNQAAESFCSGIRRFIDESN